eukprot:6407812-Amphidinium_carterae.1
MKNHTRHQTNEHVELFSRTDANASNTRKAQGLFSWPAPLGLKHWTYVFFCSFNITGQEFEQVDQYAYTELTYAPTN